jgi:beta-glucanase (GH16 family)
MPGPPPHGRLVFHDEFDGRALDERKWDWKYPRPGERAYANPANGEAQWYRRENVSEGNGVLTLTARRERTVSPFSGRVFEYTSGLVQSKPSFSFERGYVEARVRLPSGSGMWPAVWTWPRSEQWPPEIDLMELHGNDPEVLRLTYHGPGQEDSATKVYGSDWSGGWHTVGLEWRRRRLTWYVDGRAERTLPQAPRVPMYLIANLAVSNGEEAPPPTADTRFPASFEVDYVRVWRLGRR